MATMALNCLIVGDTGDAFAVRVDLWISVGELKNEIWEQKKNFLTLRNLDAGDLQLFLAKKDSGQGTWLTGEDAATVRLNDLEGFKKMNPLLFLNDSENFGESFEQCQNQIHVLVKLPAYTASTAYTPNAEIPRTTALIEPEKYAEECTTLDDWEVDSVHKIPLIWTFMSSLGGCTKTGEFFWRLEEKQVASILLDGWFRESSPGNINEFANMKSILMGSPGIGKSTLLCVMAFHLVLKHKKNVLVYRRLTKKKEENCLFYLGYEGDKVVYFSVERCKSDRAVNIYEDLGNRQGFSNVWLMLDGFRYQDIPEGLQTFRMLATSQQVDLKSQEQTDAYCCLLSSWSKKDLLLMGNLIYNFTIEDMEERFHYSGGSVREFTLATYEHIRRFMDNAVSAVSNDSKLLSTESSTFTDRAQVDRLRRTFIEDPNNRNHYLSRRHWIHMLDSQYAVSGLSVRLSAEGLLRIYTWAKNAGHGSLAGCAFEIYLHRLAGENRLTLFKSEYDLPALMEPDQPRHFSLKHLALSHRLSFCSGKPKDYVKPLTEWRDDDRYTYWYPDCDNFPNIDSIVKLAPTSRRKSNVAYLQFTIARENAIDGKQLNEMNKIFFPDDVKNAGDTDAPIYIAVCPDKESCQKFLLGPRPEVLAAKAECKIFVGYYQEAAFALAADGPTNYVPIKVREPSKYQSIHRKRKVDVMEE